MKVKQLMLGMLAFGMLTACSNEEGPTYVTPTVNHNGDYMAIDINLPTVPSTRAANDSYDDGKAEEYKVSNGCLLIFKGTDQDNATFAAAYDLNGLAASEVPDDNQDFDNNTDQNYIPDNLTSSYRKTVRLDNLSYQESDNIFAFVMLNYTDIATLTKDASGNYDNNITINGVRMSVTTTVKPEGSEEQVVTTAKSFTDLAGIVAKNPKFKATVNGVETNFFMCNAPLSNVDNSAKPTEAKTADNESFDIITLVEINKEKIFPTQAEAEAPSNSACSVNVERALAKATLKWTPTEFSADKDGDFLVGTHDKEAKGNSKNISFSFIGWALDVTEPDSYIVRNTKKSDDWWDYNNEKANNFRFVGGTKIGNTPIQKDQPLYRTYWCIDPNYSTDLIAPTTPYSNHTNPTVFVKSENQPLYCNENTFDVKHQNYRNTTRAVIQAKLEIGGKEGTFYVLNGVETEIYTNLKDVESYPRKTILESSTIHDILTNCLKENQTFETETVEDMVEIEFKRNDNTGIREVNKIAFKKLTDNELETGIFAKQPVLTDENKTQLINQANAEYVITEYKDGNTYYDVRFMHFADPSNNMPNDLAPWEIKSQIATTTEEAYAGDDAENNWLGRYGMVRNNWYELTVTSVKKLGSPVVPDVNGKRGDTSDDNKENYLSFKINVLSWAKRTQSVEF